MSRHFSIAIVLFTALALQGCFAFAQAPVTGLILTNVRSAVSATSVERGDKHGQSTSVSVLGLFAFGEASIEAAANRGNIQRISHVDTEVYSLLGLYASYTVHVYGHGADEASGKNPTKTKSASDPGK